MMKEQKLSWNNFSIKQYNELLKILVNDKDLTKMQKAIALLYGLDIESVPMMKALELQNDAIALLNTKPEIQKLLKTYKVGQYECVPVSLDRMTMAQFIDFQEFAGDGEDHLADIISICLVPKGHKYNDGYDLEQFRADVQNLPITVAPTLISFFRTRLDKYYRRSLNCLAVRILTTKGMKWKMKIALLKTLPKALQLLATLTTA